MCMSEREGGGGREKGKREGEKEGREDEAGRERCGPPS